MHADQLRNMLELGCTGGLFKAGLAKSHFLNRRALEA